MKKSEEAAAYYEGMIDGVKLFAHWKDGEQFVGTCGRSLKQAIKDLEAERDMIVNRFKEQGE